MIEMRLGWSKVIPSNQSTPNVHQERGSNTSGIPVLVPFKYWSELEQRLYSFQTIYAFLPNGTVQRGIVHGDFKLVIVDDSEADEALETIFKLIIRPQRTRLNTRDIERG